MEILTLLNQVMMDRTHKKFIRFYLFFAIMYLLLYKPTLNVKKHSGHILPVHIFASELK